MSSKDDLREHLKQARQTVGGWPEWKQRALGGGVAPGRRAQDPAQAQQTTAAAKEKQYSN